MGIDIQKIISQLKKIDVQQIAEKLRGIDFKELRNVDADQIKEALLRRPDVLINTILVFVTFVVVTGTHGGYSKKSKTLKWEISQMKERLEAVEGSNRVRKEYADLKNKIPQAILTDQIISKLSEFAAQRDVQILSFSPAQEKKEEYMTVAGVRINVSSADYEDLVLFIRDIEDAPYTMRIEKLSAAIKETLPEGKDEEKTIEQSIGADIEIGSITIKND